MYQYQKHKWKQNMNFQICQAEIGKPKLRKISIPKTKTQQKNKKMVSDILLSQRHGQKKGKPVFYYKTEPETCCSPLYMHVIYHNIIYIYALD